MTGPLAGIRVLDFSWSVAGPTVTRIMSAMGAEVMKVEWPGHPDPMRTAMFADGVEANIDSGSFFAGLSIGKESLTLDARSADGRRVVEKLIEKSDVIVESFSAKVMRRWGLDYDRMSSLHPGIIYLSVSGFGHSGPYQSYDTWGPTAQAYAGLTATSGLPGKAPAGWGYSYLDLCAGYMATVAMLSALHARQVRGIGQYIDVAQAEVGISLTGAAQLDAQLNNRSMPRAGSPTGNRAVWPGLTSAPGYRGEVGAPYGLYPTADAERHEAWVAITVMDDAQWDALCDIVADPRLTDDARFKAKSGRVRHQAEIDALLAGWTEGRLKHEIMHLLQRAGVPAGAVQNAREVLEVDPQFKHNGTFEEHPHPLLGPRRFETVPIRYSKSPVTYKDLWPILSSGNERILGDVAGLSAEQIAELNDKHVTWPEGVARNMPVKHPLW